MLINLRSAFNSAHNSATPQCPPLYHIRLRKLLESRPSFDIAATFNSWTGARFHPRIRSKGIPKLEFPVSQLWYLRI